VCVCVRVYVCMCVERRERAVVGWLNESDEESYEKSGNRVCGVCEGGVCVWGVWGVCVCVCDLCA